MTHRFIGADTETTGLDFHKGDRLVEVGLVEYVDRKPTGRTFHRYVNPQRPMDAEAFAIHGLGDDFLSKQPIFAAIADEMLSFIDGAELVIHNAEFDLTFLNGELVRCGRPPLNCDGVLDTLDYVKLVEPGKRATLDAMADRHGIDRSHRKLHGALLDAQLLCEVYVAMTRQQSDLGLLTAAARQVDQEQSSDFSGAGLIITEPSDDELQAHHEYLKALTKDAKSGCVWLNNEEHVKNSTALLRARAAGRPL